jgi:hypothetical protein
MTPDTLSAIADTVSVSSPDTLLLIKQTATDTLSLSLDQLLAMTASSQDTFTRMTGWANVKSHNGLFIAFFGQLVTFMGLVFISLGVALSNKLFDKLFKKEIEHEKQSVISEALATPSLSTPNEAIPEDHAVAIFAAIELYRRLHYGKQNSKITFRHGSESWTSWKLGKTFSQRDSRN